MVKYGDIRCILNEGMPVYRDPFQKGKLVIQFEVDFPKNHWTTEDNVKKLELLLPPKPEILVTEQMEEVELTE